MQSFSDFFSRFLGPRILNSTGWSPSAVRKWNFEFRKMENEYEKTPMNGMHEARNGKCCFLGNQTLILVFRPYACTPLVNNNWVRISYRHSSESKLIRIVLMNCQLECRCVQANKFILLETNFFIKFWDTKKFPGKKKPFALSTRAQLGGLFYPNPRSNFTLFRSTNSPTTLRSAKST